MKHELTPEVVKQIVDFAKKYEQKGDLVGIPLEVISKMLQRQYEQTGKWDVEVFEKDITDDDRFGGFDWDDTIEKWPFWSETLIEKNFTDFFTRYPERFESEPKYRDSLGYPLEIGEEIYVSQSIKNTLIFRYKNVFTGMVGEKFKGNFFTTKYAISAKAYQSNPFEVIKQVKQLEQPEPPKQEEKPTKPVYVTPCGTFTEGEEVCAGSAKRIFYKYDEKLEYPYLCVDNEFEKKYINGDKFNICNWLSISKLPPLPTIEEVASKAGISVEQLKDIVKEGK